MCLRRPRLHTEGHRHACRTRGRTSGSGPDTQVEFCGPQRASRKVLSAATTVREADGLAGWGWGVTAQPRLRLDVPEKPAPPHPPPGVKKSPHTGSCARGYLTKEQAPGGQGHHHPRGTPPHPSGPQPWHVSLLATQPVILPGSPHRTQQPPRVTPNSVPPAQPPDTRALLTPGAAGGSDPLLGQGG